MSVHANKKTLSRRGFFRLGRSQGQEPETKIRPPAIDHSLFDANCDGCGDCARACPENIIQIQQGKPEISFENSGCDFCGDCAKACARKVFLEDCQSTWQHRMKVTASCLNMSGVVCQSCRDGCDVRAISFSVLKAGITVPVINQETCTGCGFCLAICPTTSIKIVNEGAQFNG